MSADVAQPPSSPPSSPPRIAGSRSSTDQQSSGSSSLRLSDERDKKSPPPPASLTGSLYLRRTRRRSDCTETGSIGYGSSAPLESETSYSSHPGYPAKPPAQLQAKTSCTELQVVSQQPPHHHSHQNQRLSSPSSASQSSSSTPSSGAYVDVSSSTRLAGPPSSTTTTTTTSNGNGNGGGRRPRNAIVKGRPNGLTAGLPSTSSWNGYPPAAESQTDYVVDAERGNAYVKGQLLGKGGFAKVYLITDIATRKPYACKIIPKHQMQKIHMQKIAREILIHKELNHVNIVQMHHYFEDSLNVYMMLEACPKKSLVHVLKYRGKVTEPEARYYMRQMVNGVAYIHSRKVIHRDLKPSNVFLSERMIVKIGDFGLATQPDGQRRRVTICGTPNFIAPEVLFKQSCSYEADVWALGCILYALLVGQPPFDSSTMKETYSLICNHRYKELDDASATRAGQDLVRWLLQPNPELRPSLELVKEHPYLTREYVPTTLPDSCYYQAPRLSLLERVSALSTNVAYPPAQHNLGLMSPHEQQIQAHSQPAQQAQSQSQKSQDGKKAKTKKKKVSSWLASWRLPKLPRFRQRISSVLCLEARKKQPLGAAGEEGALALIGATQSLLMSRALEECLAATAKGLRPRFNPGLVEDYAPLFVTKWIDYSNKYGLAFQLSDRSVGVLFNDNTKMSYTHDRRRVEYMTTDDEVTRYNRERNVPAHLQEKLDLLRHFTDYMDKHLTEGGEVSAQRDEGQGASSRRSSKSSHVPLMRRWLRTSKAIVMELNVPLLQMNFFEDHTKLIVSLGPQQPPQQQTRAGASAASYLVTYIDGERHASSYWLNDLRDFGCTAELHERLLYIYKVAKEFAEHDATQQAH